MTRVMLRGLGDDPLSPNLNLQGGSAPPCDT